MLRRRPVMRTVARTAVVAGTATVVAGGVARHQQKKYGQQAPAEAPAEAPAAEPEPAYEPAPAGPDPLEQLKELGQLRDSGVLTEAEFQVQKEKILQA
jgi:Short C-terminal domain